MPGPVLKGGLLIPNYLEFSEFDLAQEIVFQAAIRVLEGY